VATSITLVNKKPKLQSSTSSIYREEIIVVDDSSTGSNELLGPIAAGTAITLPLGKTYTGNELQLKLNGIDLVPVRDYNFVGTAPRTQVSFTFILEGTRANPDSLEFFINA